MDDISQELIQRAVDGDWVAFETIYKITSPFVYNVAKHVVDHNEDAKEVVQEVFLLMHQKLKSFRFESSFKTWVYRMTVNHAISLVRKRPKEKIVELDPEVCATAVSVKDDAVVDKEHRDYVVEKLLKTLSPDYRACIILRNLEGLSYEQIAQTLKININTVRTRLKRAREKLLQFKNKVQDESLF